MNRNLLNNPTREGYILIPRLLLRQVLKKREKTPMSEEEAFLTLLFLAAFQDGKTDGSVIKRGELNISQEKLRKMFNWTQWRIRKFLSLLEDMKVISRVRRGNIYILRIECYELFCANKKLITDTETTGEKNKNDQLFEQFWKDYHELSGIEPSDMCKAKRIWKKLSIQEKFMAKENIYSYVMQIEKIRFIKKAANYLGDRAFLLGT